MKVYKWEGANMKKVKKLLGILLFSTILVIANTIPAAAESLLDDITETETTEDFSEDTEYSMLRGVNLNLGTTKITKVASNKVAINGRTQCHHVCAKVYLDIYLERKVNGTYSVYKSWSFTADNASKLNKDLTVIVPSGSSLFSKNGSPLIRCASSIRTTPSASDFNFQLLSGTFTPISF